MTMSLSGSLLNTASGGLVGQYPSYGLSMRFQVAVDALGVNLGLWQSCKGLEVELQYKKFEQGGNNLGQQWLPDKIVYGAVTLERAVDQSSSATVRGWLQNWVTAWTNYGTLPATTVTVQLLDYQQNPVMRWALSNARPSKWIGPSLSATEEKVAIETLVLEHDGFL
jgi:phage tail-like protein